MSENKKPRGRFNAEVKFIFDGDTFAIKHKETGDEYRIRLYGIDAPERGQEYGGIAQYEMQERVLNKDVQVEFMQTAHKGREVAMVWINGQCLNLQMIQEGLAWKSIEHGDRYSDKFIRESINAKVERKGLWARENPEEPYKYRQRINLEDQDHYKAAVARDKREVAAYKVALKNATPNIIKYRTIKPSEMNMINNTFKSDYDFKEILKAIKNKFNVCKDAVLKIRNNKKEHDDYQTIFNIEPNISVNEAIKNKRRQNKP
jgi:micrococcal nuclease